MKVKYIKDYRPIAARQPVPNSVYEVFYVSNNGYLLVIDGYPDEYDQNDFVMVDSSPAFFDDIEEFDWNTNSALSSVEPGAILFITSEFLEDKLLEEIISHFIKIGCKQLHFLGDDSERAEKIADSFLALHQEYDDPVVITLSYEDTREGCEEAGFFLGNSGEKKLYLLYDYEAPFDCLTDMGIVLENL